MKTGSVRKGHTAAGGASTRWLRSMRKVGTLSWSKRRIAGTKRRAMFARDQGAVARMRALGVHGNAELHEDSQGSLLLETGAAVVTYDVDAKAAASGRTLDSAPERRHDG
jgi:hypothetical protein